MSRVAINRIQHLCVHIPKYVSSIVYTVNYKYSILPIVTMVEHLCVLHENIYVLELWISPRPFDHDGVRLNTVWCRSRCTNEHSCTGVALIFHEPQSGYGIWEITGRGTVYSQEWVTGRREVVIVFVLLFFSNNSTLKKTLAINPKKHAGK